MPRLPLLGGGAMILGALLPWMTFYAGLKGMSGASGWYGRMLLAAGVLVCAVVLWSGRAPRAWVRPMLSVVGLGAVVASALIVWRAWRMLRDPAMAMLVPQWGPGLFVMMGGAIVVLLAGVRRRSPR